MLNFIRFFIFIFAVGIFSSCRNKTPIDEIPIIEDPSHGYPFSKDSVLFTLYNLPDVPEVDSIEVLNICSHNTFDFRTYYSSPGIIYWFRYTNTKLPIKY